MVSEDTIIASPRKPVKTSRIVLESDRRVKWTKDGEYAGAYKRVVLTNLHKKLQILVPQED